MNLRELFIQWLTASRYIQSLEARIHEQRQDYEVRIGEKNQRINELRAELAAMKMDCERMRNALLPFGSPAGAEFARRYNGAEKPPRVPAFDGPDDWNSELNRMYKTMEEENGSHSEGRQAVHEPSADDAAQ